MRGAIGARDWCEQTNGRLSATEKLAMAGMVVRARLSEFAEAARSTQGSWRTRLAQVDLAAVPQPDTAMVRQAETIASDVYSEPLRLHCYRTYWWGALLAQFDGLAFDAEVLLVAALLHDLGLTPAALTQVAHCCFAAEGARQAETLAAEAGWTELRRLVLYDAISLHLNPIVDADLHGAEAKLLADGATLDVIGARRRAVPAHLAQEIHSRFPRGGFRADILATIKRRHAPHTRAAFLAPGFARLARANPLDRMR